MSAHSSQHGLTVSKSETVAAIDIGTNSIHLVIARIDHRVISPVRRLR